MMDSYIMVKESSQRPNEECSPAMENRELTTIK